jgi:subtilisin family serine protease
MASLAPKLFAALVALPILTALGPIPLAHAWLNDQDANRIDDRIERVQALGFRAAFVDDDPARPQRFGVQQGAALVYAIYVRYDHIPSAIDAAAVSATGVPWVRPYRVIPYLRTEATFPQIQAISALVGVTRIEVVPVLYPANHIGSRVVRARDSRGYVKAQNDVLFPSARQNLGLDGRGIVVAIFDTGVNDAPDLVNPGYPGHESLLGKFLGGGEFFYGNPLQNTPPGSSMNPQDHGADASQYHATHVAGTAIGTGGVGGTFAGVAPAARLVDIKVLSDAGASVGGLPDAVEWCLYNKNTLWPGLSGADSIYRGIDVINMSLGDVLSSDGSEADALAVKAAVTGGIVVVCASGNLGLTGWIASPGSADSSICVGATSHSKSLDRGDDRVTSFSQEGVRADDGDADHVDEMKPNVVAPGNGIISANGDPTTGGHEYKGLSGTSMASPHMAGCAALLLQANPSLTPLQVRSILQNTAEHDILSEKGDRPNDPFGLDPNYDPGCGWGLVDIYAAAKEALGSSSGVQVTQMKKPVARFQDGAIDLGWITQREYPFLGFEVHRAPDVNGAPGTYARINALLVPPSLAGDPLIQGDDNRTSYAYTDSDPALESGRTYWYRVAWVDLLGAHPEPGLPVSFGSSPRVATVHYTITHDAPDSDLDIQVGTSSSYTPQAADFVTAGPGVAQQDSAQIANIDFFYVPPGHIRHFWSVGLTTDDGVTGFLPPGQGHPWFLNVTEGGFADQFGQLESFSLFVNDSPGSSSGTTYDTDSMVPRPTIETTSTPLWIPEPQATLAPVANFAAAGEADGVRVTLLLASSVEGWTARLLRSTSDDLVSAQPLTETVAMAGSRLEHLDRSAEAGVTYHYWAELADGRGGVIVTGPVSGRIEAAGAITHLAPAMPNPAAGSRVFAYAVGADVAAAGPVGLSLVLYNVRGQVVRALARGMAEPGQHQLSWDGLDAKGAPVAPGIYLLRFQAGAHVEVERVGVVR